MFRNLFGSRREQSKARRPQTTVPPRLEVLEDRTSPSVTPLNPQPFIITASPPAEAQVVAIRSFVFSMAEQQVQQIATIVQYASNALNTLGQEIIQEVAAVQLQMGRIFGINPHTPNQSTNAALSPSGSDSGASGGNNSGAVNGGSTTATHGNGSQQGAIKVHPKAESGGDTIGTGGFGEALVYGQVWLDNNADGTQQVGEFCQAGIEVQLYYVSSSGGSLVGTAITDAAGGYQIPVSPVSSLGNQYYQVHVGFLPYDYATNPGPDSQIDMNGFTAPFALAAGTTVQKNAGLASMNVTTTDDDPDQAIPGKITLRDAIKTGNKGIPFPIINPAVTFYTDQRGGLLSGTISLEKALDPIEKSYDIDGPGATTLSVQGGDGYRVFLVDAGVTSTISGLTIEGGVVRSESGGGVLNSGNLTLNGDIVTDNQALGNGLPGSSGGGIYNVAGGQLQLDGVLISDNLAGSWGGGILNDGLLTINSSEIDNNVAVMGGGGICNDSCGMTTATDGILQIHNNWDNSNGGGVYNAGTFIMDGGFIYNNQEQGRGGGVFNNGTMTLDNVTIGGLGNNDKNQASDGGGLYVAGGTAKVSGGYIEGNSASGSGGGIYVIAGKLTLSDAFIGGNVAGLASGGGICISGGTVNVTGGSVAANISQGNSGGGIYVAAGSLTMKDDYAVAANKAPNGFGGGIMIREGKVTLSGGSIGDSNGTGLSGGGIYNSTGTLTIQNDVQIFDNGAGANSEGGGMYLQIGSTTTFVGNANAGNPACTIEGNSIGGGVVAVSAGLGVYQQVNKLGNAWAIINNWLAVIDKDDPGGVFVPGL